MTVRWNANQPLALKRAFVMVNATEVIIISAIILAIRLGTHPIPLPVPDDQPVIVIPYPDAPWGPPPTIVPDARPVNPTELELPNADVGTGIVIPAPDKDALLSAGPTIGELSRALAPDPHTNPEPGVMRIEPDTAKKAPPSDTEAPVIPGPRDFVRTTQPPELIKAPEPDYPESCRLLGIENSTWVQMLLGLDGAVMQTRVAKTSGNAELDSAAVKAARRATFTPALGANHKPVHVWVSMQYEFKLSR